MYLQRIQLPVRPVLHYRGWKEPKVEVRGVQPPTWAHSRVTEGDPSWQCSPPAAAPRPALPMEDNQPAVPERRARASWQEAGRGFPAALRGCALRFS